MKSTKKKLKKRYNLILIIACSLFLLFIVFLLFYFSRRTNTLNVNNIIVEPREKIVVNYDFESEVFFNDKLGENIFSQEIIKSIDEAQESVEVAVYSMNHPEIKEALIRAIDRGVRIDVLLCEKGKPTHDNFFADIDQYINRKDIKFSSSSLSLVSESYLMHHKFMIIDRNLDKRVLFFGSYNFTYLQEKYDPSFVLKTYDPSFVKIFGEEFDRINFGLHGKEKKLQNINPFAARIEYTNGFVEIWFSPGTKSVNLKSRMSELIKSTKERIRMMIWLWTDKSLAKDILNLDSEIKISIITDEININHENSIFKDLLKLGVEDNIEIITDEKRQFEIQELRDDILNSFLHHHALIIDDKILITGTSNWSTSGFFNNDESMIVSDVYPLVESFIDSFKTNYLINK
jgi:phosphatidylserine/phosphatidylglycerophosphate/cardiolipin synthase-like enzyme